jgi:hypothetical protein
MMTTILLAFVDVGVIFIQYINGHFILRVSWTFSTARRLEAEEQIFHCVDEILELGVIESTKLEYFGSVRRMIEKHRRLRFVYEIFETFEVANSRQVTDCRRYSITFDPDRLAIADLKNVR